MTLSELLKVCRFNYIGIYSKGEFCGNFSKDEWSTWPEDCAYMGDTVVSFSEGFVRLNGCNESASKLDIHLISPKDTEMINNLIAAKVVIHEYYEEKSSLELGSEKPLQDAINYAIEKVKDY